MKHMNYTMQNLESSILEDEIKANLWKTITDRNILGVI